MTLHMPHACRTWKNFSSVSTLRQAAPPASYAFAMRTGSKSCWMTPLLGDAFFTSAIKPGLPAARKGGG